MSYKQKLIPVVDDAQFAGMTLGDIKNYVKKYYHANIKDKVVVNKAKGISIKFGRKGLDHVIHARSAGYVKIKAVIVISQMVQHAEYSNYKDNTKGDINVIGFIHLKSKVKVENKIQVFRIIVRITKDGKFYYDHAVKVKK